MLMAAGGQILMAACVLGQGAEEVDHVAVIEIGGAGEWGLAGGLPNFGGTLAVEVTPIERWLEVEAGVSALGTSGQHQIAADLVFKKPFKFSPGVEFMPGIGPEISWPLNGGSPAQSLAAECVLDFMFWPAKNIGWYLEPSYSFTSLQSSRGSSLGLTGGLLIGLPLR